MTVFFLSLKLNSYADLILLHGADLTKEKLSIRNLLRPFSFNEKCIKLKRNTRHF